MIFVFGVFVWALVTGHWWVALFLFLGSLTIVDKV